MQARSRAHVTVGCECPNGNERKSPSVTTRATPLVRKSRVAEAIALSPMLPPPAAGLRDSARVAEEAPDGATAPGFETATESRLPCGTWARATAAKTTKLHNESSYTPSRRRTGITCSLIEELFIRYLRSE